MNLVGLLNIICSNDLIVCPDFARLTVSTSGQLPSPCLNFEVLFPAFLIYKGVVDLSSRTYTDYWFAYQIH